MIIIEPRHEESVFGLNVNSKDADQPSEIYSLITNFAILCSTVPNDSICGQRMSEARAQADLGIRWPH